MNPREALLALNLLPEVGPVGIRRLLEKFGDAPAVLAAPARALMEVNRIGPKVAGLITRWENHVDLAGVLERIRNFDCTLLTQEDDLYPPLLHEIYDPPIILYMRGKMEERDRYALAMVGTQFPFGRRGDKQSFPIRNRIVAGMTQGTIVVEANRSSGALITANFSVEYGRTVYAVPGRIDSPRSAGCHGLIKDGAQLCESAEDVLAEFANHNYSSNEQPELPLPALTSAEQTIYNVLTHEEMQQDAIIRRSELPPAQVSVALLQLEMKKLIQQHPGRIFTRAR